MISLLINIQDDGAKVRLTGLGASGPSGHTDKEQAAVEEILAFVQERSQGKMTVMGPGKTAGPGKAAKSVSDVSSWTFVKPRGAQ